MALALRLRRAIAASAPLFKEVRAFSPISNPSVVPPPLGNLNPSFRPHSHIQSYSFRPSSASSERRNNFGGESDIKPDDILFEGCDYNHWLITMDFPKDPKPTPEEMVETYVQTLAKVVGSVEEAKRRMYACSTTTYQGFQAVMTEEMSEKFRGLPGVVFILPDSYIDPAKKEYGGDKYDNGVITPRPPPIQYGSRQRPRNQNQDFPRYERQRDSMAPQQGYPPQDRGNYGPQQNYVQSGQDGRGYTPPSGPSGERRDFGQGPPRDYSQAGGGRGYAGGERDGYNGERRDPVHSYQRDFSQGQQGNVAPQQQNNFSQGYGGNYGNTGPYGPGDYRQGSGPAPNVDYRQGSGPGYNAEYRQGPNSGYNPGNRQGPGSGYGGDYRQGSGSGGHNYNGPVEDQTESGQGGKY